MNRFDEDLREALRRRQPPGGFAEGVLARVRESEAPRKPSFPWRWIAAAAAAVLFLTVGLSVYREHLRRVEGEQAKEQVMFALRLTGSKLRGIQEHVQQRTIELPVQ
jgi:hypothetical protein